MGSSLPALGTAIPDRVACVSPGPTRWGGRRTLPVRPGRRIDHVTRVRDRQIGETELFSGRLLKEISEFAVSAPPSAGGPRTARDAARGPGKGAPFPRRETGSRELNPKKCIVHTVEAGPGQPVGGADREGVNGGFGMVREQTARLPANDRKQGHWPLRRYFWL